MSTELSKDDQRLVKEVMTRARELLDQTLILLEAPDEDLVSKYTLIPLLEESIANANRLKHLANHPVVGGVIAVMIQTSESYRRTIERQIGELLPGSKTRQSQAAAIAKLEIMIAIGNPISPDEKPVIVGEYQKYDAAGRIWGPQELAALLLSESKSTPYRSAAGLRCVDYIVKHGLAGVMNVWESVVRDGNPPDEGSVLVWMSDLIAHEFRRRVLMDVLEECGWNLTKASERLRLGGTANLRRQLRELGIEDEFRKRKETSSGA